MSIYERIKYQSGVRGLSLQEVARRAKIGINSIYRWRNANPSLVKLEKVAHVLGVSTDYLLHGELIEISNKEAEAVIKKFNALGAVISALDIADLDSTISEVKAYREPENATDDDIKATAEEMRDVLNTVANVFRIGARGLLAGQQARNTLQAIDKLTIKYDNEGAKKDIMARREDEES